MTNYEPRSMVQTVMIDRLVAYKSVTEVRKKVEETYLEFKVVFKTKFFYLFVTDENGSPLKIKGNAKPKAFSVSLIL